MHFYFYIHINFPSKYLNLGVWWLLWHWRGSIKGGLGCLRKVSIKWGVCEPQAIAFLFFPPNSVSFLSEEKRNSEGWIRNWVKMLQKSFIWMSQGRGRKQWEVILKLRWQEKMLNCLSVKIFRIHNDMTLNIMEFQRIIYICVPCLICLIIHKYYTENENQQSF